MLGWHVSVYRFRDLGPRAYQASSTDGQTVEAPREAADSRGDRLAVWQTGTYGRDWIDGLVKEGHAFDLGGDGYPDRYAGWARHLLPLILDGPPGAKPVWGASAGDVLLPNWEGRTSVAREAAARCDPDEWLLVEAWDES